MLNKLSINIRVLMLILMPALIFAAIFYLSFKDLKSNESAFETTNSNLEIISLGADLSASIDEHYTNILGDLRRKKITWEESKDKTLQGQQILIDKFKIFNEAIPAELIDEELTKDLAKFQEKLTSHHTLVLMFLNGTDSAGLYLDDDQVRSDAAGFLMEEQFFNAQDMHTTINKIDEIVFDYVSKSATQMVDDSYANSKSAVVAISLGIFLIIIAGYFISRSIRKPTNELYQVVSRLSEGEYDARARVIGTDEIAKLSTAINTLLDDRATTLDKIDSEHQELNYSVFNLLTTVAELSEKDLTIRAEVSEDATGPVADALNLLAEETSSTLKEVRNVAFNVSSTSQKVNTHIKSVNKLAVNEHKGALETAEQMNLMLQRLDSISKSATNTSKMVKIASVSTKQAHESVTDTLGDMSNIRTTVQETGKRIKQLGERSEEISNVIDIINTIAERTTVLALNASMQAVKAGDAGKGFAVIAEEIQRLSESSRESTSEISTLVNNIQQETNTTIATMDKTIKQVIEGSTKAEDAASQMQSVLDSTNELVSAVDRIATSSLDQVDISQNLKIKAEGILESTQVTGQELLSLTGLSRNMSEYAQQLVSSVDVFTLEKNINAEDNIESA